MRYSVRTPSPTLPEASSWLLGLSGPSKSPDECAPPPLKRLRTCKDASGSNKHMATICENCSEFSPVSDTSDNFSDFNHLKRRHTCRDTSGISEGVSECNKPMTDISESSESHHMADICEISSGSNPMSICQKPRRTCKDTSGISEGVSEPNICENSSESKPMADIRENSSGFNPFYDNFTEFNNRPKLRQTGKDDDDDADDDDDEVFFSANIHVETRSKRLQRRKAIRCENYYKLNTSTYTKRRLTCKDASGSSEGMSESNKPMSDIGENSSESHPMSDISENISESDNISEFNNHLKHRRTCKPNSEGVLEFNKPTGDIGKNASEFSPLSDICENISESKPMSDIRENSSVFNPFYENFTEFNNRPKRRPTGGDVSGISEGMSESNKPWADIGENSSEFNKPMADIGENSSDFYKRMAEAWEKRCRTHKDTSGISESVFESNIHENSSESKPMSDICENGSESKPMSDICENGSESKPMSDICENSSESKPMSDICENSSESKPLSDIYENSSESKPMSYICENGSQSKPMSDICENSSESKPMSDICENSSEAQPMSDICENSSESKPMSDIYENGSQSKPMSDICENGSQSKPMSDICENSSEAKPMSDIYENSSESKPLSDIYENSSKSKPMSDICENSSEAKPDIYENSSKSKPMSGIRENSSGSNPFYYDISEINKLLERRRAWRNDASGICECNKSMVEVCENGSESNTPMANISENSSKPNPIAHTCENGSESNPRSDIRGNISESIPASISENGSDLNKRGDVCENMSESNPLSAMCENTSESNNPMYDIRELILKSNPTADFPYNISEFNNHVSTDSESNNDLCNVSVSSSSEMMAETNNNRLLRILSEAASNIEIPTDSSSSEEDTLSPGKKALNLCRNDSEILWSSIAVTQDMWVSLPSELWLMVAELGSLSTDDRLSMTQTCQRLKDIFSHPSVWHVDFVLPQYFNERGSVEILETDVEILRRFGRHLRGLAIQEWRMCERELDPDSYEALQGFSEANAVQTLDVDVSCSEDTVEFTERSCMLVLMGVMHKAARVSSVIIRCWPAHIHLFHDTCALNVIHPKAEMGGRETTHPTNLTETEVLKNARNSSRPTARVFSQTLQQCSLLWREFELGLYEEFLTVQAAFFSNFARVSSLTMRAFNVNEDTIEAIASQDHLKLQELVLIIEASAEEKEAFYVDDEVLSPTTWSRIRSAFDRHPTPYLSITVISDVSSLGSEFLFHVKRLHAAMDRLTLKFLKDDVDVLEEGLNAVCQESQLFTSLKTLDLEFKHTSGAAAVLDATLKAKLLSMRDTVSRTFGPGLVVNLAFSNGEQISK